MSHVKYSPIGYSYNADNYCLDCIATVVSPHGGVRPAHCNCAECRLDRIARKRGIDRYDEYSFDSSDFPKSIPYHNDIHAECDELTCNARCAKCHDVIDGTGRYIAGEYKNICPAYDYYLDNKGNA
jgi:hypothetical protein